MAVLEIGEHLRDRLGADASADLLHTFTVVQAEMLTLASDRFEARLTAVCAQLRSDLREEIVNGDASIRIALADGVGQIRREMSDMRVEVLRWSFVFWIGQVAAMAGMFALLARWLGR